MIFNFLGSDKLKMLNATADLDLAPSSTPFLNNNKMRYLSLIPIGYTISFNPKRENKSSGKQQIAFLHSLWFWLQQILEILTSNIDSTKTYSIFTSRNSTCSLIIILILEEKLSQKKKGQPNLEIKPKII